MERLLGIFTFAAITTFAALCQAADTPSLDVDKLSDAELQKLPQEQFKSLPLFKVSGRLDPKTAGLMRASVPLMLRDLGYGFREAFTGTDEQLQQWVTQFQRDIREPQTGAITFGQLDTLSQRVATVKATRVSLPLGDKKGPSITVTKEWASADGTWIIEDDQIADPLNFTRCYRQIGYCFQSDVAISDHDRGSYIVWTYQDAIPIASWSDDEVVANKRFARRPPPLSMRELKRSTKSHGTMVTTAVASLAVSPNLESQSS